MNILQLIGKINRVTNGGVKDFLNNNIERHINEMKLPLNTIINDPNADPNLKDKVKEEINELDNIVKENPKKSILETWFPTIAEIFKPSENEENEDIPITGETEKTNNSELNETVNYDDLLKKYEKYQNELWAREDAIRKETQAREDSAYQRAVEDARKAGINLNLLGINPANSGGGITQATSTLSNMNNELNIIKDYSVAKLQNLLKESEGNKDRIQSGANDIIDDIVKIVSTILFAKMK